jgi:hypothetical protein
VGADLVVDMADGAVRVERSWSAGSAYDQRGTAKQFGRKPGYLGRAGCCCCGNLSEEAFFGGIADFPAPSVMISPNRNGLPGT